MLEPVIMQVNTGFDKPDFHEAISIYQYFCDRMFFNKVHQNNAKRRIRLVQIVKPLNSNLALRVRYF